jgi:hypothetical protein
VMQWLEWRYKDFYRSGVVQWSDLMVLMSPVEIPLWDVGAGPLDETVYSKVPCGSRCGM